ncbi:OB-fold protein [Psychrobacter sp. FME5]|uniref:OB-fold protein n=1 Tax=Psychrobacter sp. FME5 TaxID=2487706 RepID=UPI001788696D|nr:hypothetical protein [Psychrobacter sp. FME5]MBE0446027.1 hypothetical protein [Psychrobacter sp. FME5]
MIKKILIGIVVAFILLMIIGALLGDDTTDSTTNSEVSSSAEPAELIAVTARELFTAYDKNEVAADKQFKGKMLEVTATVSSIDSGFSDNAIVQLNTGNDFQSVSAEGDETFTDIASTLNKGQEVTMICQGGGEIIGSPMLDNCVIQ